MLLAIALFLCALNNNSYYLVRIQKYRLLLLYISGLRKLNMVNSRATFLSIEWIINNSVGHQQTRLLVYNWLGRL